MKPNPPRWATWLLTRWGHPNTVEEVQGDLLELYAHWVQTVGERKARWRYGLSALKLLRPLAKSNHVSEYAVPFFLSPMMLRNYFKISWRNLVKNKAYSVINIGGLAVGMVVAMLIGLWIWDELSFDQYHQNHRRLAQVMNTQTFNGETSTSEAVAIPLAEELRRNHADDFKRVALVYPNFMHTLTVGDKTLSQSGVWAQPDLPEMLSLRMMAGSRDALRDPSSVLLTQSLAKALFGEADPINKLVNLDNHLTVKVAGVFEDLPQNTTFHDTKLFLSWDKALSFIGGMKEAQTAWDFRYYKLFVQLTDQADPNQATAKIRDIPKQHVKEGAEELLLHPMDDWHLYGEFKNGAVAGGRIQYVWLFGIIGGFVVLLACINFMNLSTARSAIRAKEVGIRKAVGSRRGQLIGQFLSESLLVALLALLLSLGLVQVTLPFFQQLTGKTLSVFWTNPLFWVSTLGFTLFTGLVSGSYPAFYLSGFESVKVLKGSGSSSRFRVGRFASLPRRMLVVVQFTVSITLIIGTILVYQQIQHAKNRPIGYTREGLLTVAMNTPELFGAPYNALRNELIESGAVADLAQSSTPSTETPHTSKGFDWKGKPPGSVPLLEVLGVTHDFGKTIGWKLKEGRDFSRSFPTDSGSVILNEAAARLTGFKHPVGEIIRWDGQPHRITGIVNDIVIESPFKPVQPTVFLLDYRWANFITIRIKPTKPLREALATLEAVFKRVNPAGDFDYKFTDAEYARKFSDEERIGTLAAFFATLAIFISCLGLFGLASFMAEQRTKEIGIRKVLGATVLNLWGLLSKDYVVLVLIAFGIATPLAWYFLHGWLQNYEYRTEISGWVFVASGAGALAVTLLTVSFQSLKAALTNPVKSLRCE